ncbi:hypothetical protein DITRI_Ditri11bG0179200 [Diplodiscus trichospermus]
MEPSPSGMRKRSGVRGGTRMEWLEHDILCLIFSFLDVFDLVRCTAVCKSWNAVIKKSELLQVLYFKLRRDSSVSSSSEQSWQSGLEEIALKHHRLSLLRGRIDIHQWKGHSVGVDQCRMKMGLLLTGVGDKVMRLWSLDSYRCVEEYHIPDTLPLLDFDFDETKIVGLLGTRVGIWRRNGKRSIFPSREGTFSRGLCMRYIDPEAVIGCEDGTARVFDLYSRTCSRIIKMHAGPVTCLSLSDDQLILSGSSLGSVAMSSLSSDQRVATLRSTNSAGYIIKHHCIEHHFSFLLLLWYLKHEPNSFCSDSDRHKDPVFQSLFSFSVCRDHGWIYILLGPSDHEIFMEDTNKFKCSLFLASFSE